MALHPGELAQDDRWEEQRSGRMMALHCRSRAGPVPSSLGGQFRSLAEPWAETATSTGRLMIAVFGGLADVERDLIRTRTAEGRNRAKARGQHMGRPSKLTDAQKAEARRRRAEGATLVELARSYDVGKSTISRLTG